MRRQSILKSGKAHDGLTTPTSTSPDSTGQPGSYFTFRRATNATISEGFPSTSPFYLVCHSKRKRSTTTETVTTPPESQSPKTPHVKDWNITRLYDVKPAESSQSMRGQGPSADSVSDWNVSRNYDPKPLLPQQPIDPPRPPREGCEWVWFPAGYWAERERVAFIDPLTIPKRRKSSHFNSWFRQTGRKYNSSVDSCNSTSPRSSMKLFCNSSSKSDAFNSFRSSKYGSVLSAGSRTSSLIQRLSTFTPNYSRYTSTTGEPEGLYRKTKRGLALPFTKIRRTSSKDEPTANSSRAPSSTTMLLEGASGYFEQVDRSSGANSNATLGSSNDSTPGRKPRRKFGLAPWHRRLSDNSLLSASSSVHEVLMGKTPLGTPKSEARYIGTKGKSYIKVEIADAEGPSFLPSEARRLNTPPDTPPLPSPARQSPARLSPKDAAEKKTDDRRPAIKSRIHSPGPHSRLIDRPSSSCESLESEKNGRPKSTSGGHSAGDGRHPFTLSIPDHLPSSPLCPLNPEHASKGNGICPLHGRRRSTSPVSNIEIRVSSE